MWLAVCKKYMPAVGKKYTGNFEVLHAPEYVAMGRDQRLHT